jgi:hypothetical protein
MMDDADRQVRSCLREYGNTDVKIMAKVERPGALDCIDEIISASDAIMVARGSLPSSSFVVIGWFLFETHTLTPYCR